MAEELHALAMLPSTYFFLIFLATIVITRVALLPRRAYCPTIIGFRLHHYMYGLVLMLISWSASNIFLFAIGLALLVDELPQMLSGKLFYGWNVYYSSKIMLGVILFMFLVFLLRNQIISII